MFINVFFFFFVFQKFTPTDAILRLRRSGTVFIERGNTQIHVQEAKAFLSNYVHTLGDMMRQNLNSHLQRLIQVHLPTCLKKEDIYNKMCKSLKSRDIKPCSFSHFRRVWPKNVKIRKVTVVLRLTKSKQ